MSKILNPDAVGDPDQTPIVELSPEAVEHFERTRCPECRLINHFHGDDCSQGVPPEVASCTRPIPPGGGRDV